MSERSLSETAAGPAALMAFLRGIERRAAIFAQLQCGDAERGDAALAAVMRAFPLSAASAPVATWPSRFWALLLAAPPLRRDSAACWPQGFTVLSQLGAGPRAALLLRLVAGLPEAQAAVALGIAVQTYRLALRRALPRHGDDSLDATSWRDLDAAVQQLIRQLPASRLARLAQSREAAMQSRRPRPGPATSPGKTRPRWLMPSLWTGVVACVLGLAASFVLPGVLSGLLRGNGDEPHILRAALPPAEPPAATFDALTALLTDRDFELLADDADAATSGASGDLAFQSWYAAQLATSSAHTLDNTVDATIAEPTVQHADATR